MSFIWITTAKRREIERDEQMAAAGMAKFIRDQAKVNTLRPAREPFRLPVRKEPTQ